MNKYKVGDIVRVDPELETGSIIYEVTFSAEMEKFKGNCFKISRVCRDHVYNLEGCSDWTFAEHMLIPPELKKGDIVRLNPDARLEDFARYGTSLYIYEGTAALLSAKLGVSSFDHEFTVKEGRVQGGVNTLLLEEFEDYCFESALFTLVRRPKEIKEVTMAEVEEKFGCKVKIVKG